MNLLHANKGTLLSNANTTQSADQKIAISSIGVQTLKVQMKNNEKTQKPQKTMHG